MNPVYLYNWAIIDRLTGHSKGIECLKSDFHITDADLEGVEILLASYGCDNYSGDAFVLFRKDGKYYEVNGSHCSCYGLEGQWEPEEASIDELLHRIEEGRMGSDYCGNVYADELKEILLKIKAGD